MSATLSSYWKHVLVDGFRLNETSFIHAESSKKWLGVAEMEISLTGEIVASADEALEIMIPEIQ